MNRIEGFFVRRKLNKVEEETPMIRKTLDWLTDPEHPGRKRGVAAACMVLSGALRGAGEGVKQACEASLILSAGVCSFDYAGAAHWIGFGGSAVYAVVLPGVTLAGVIFGVWGLLDARQKN